MTHRPSLPHIPRGRATTAQLGVTYPFQAGASLGPRGVYLGEDVLAGGGAFCFDPFQAYRDGVITSPNMVVLGQLGSGKSAFVKTFLHRSVGLLGDRNGGHRRVVIADPKGEYGPLALALGLDVLRLHPGGAVRLNPLDADPAVGFASLEEIALRRTSLLIALSGEIAGAAGRRVSALERSTIAWIVETLTVNSAGIMSPTLGDVVRLLENPTEEIAARAGRTSRELSREVEHLRFELLQLLDGPLRGMFDGRSTVTIDWSGRGVVLDLSVVKDDPAALAIVMLAASGWLDSVLTAGASRDDGSVWYQVIDEGWALLGSEDRARNYQAKQKLARSYGVINILVVHRISDLAAQADDGTATAKIGAGLLADTPTRVLFRQDGDQTRLARSALQLTETEAALLPKLAVGRALWKVGNHSAVVQHRVAAPEWRFARTDDRMTA